MYCLGNRHFLYFCFLCVAYIPFNVIVETDLPNHYTGMQYMKEEKKNLYLLGEFETDLPNNSTGMQYLKKKKNTI